MAITLTPKNSRFSRNLYWMGLPHTNLTTDVFLFGKDARSSTKNLAPYGKGDAEQVRSVDYGNNYAKVGMNNFILASDAILTKPFTILAAIQPTTQTGLQFALGTYDGQSKGVLVYGSGGIIYAGGELVSSANNINLPATFAADKFTMVGIAYNGEKFKLFTFNNGSLITAEATSAATLTPVILRFGSPIGFAYADFNIAFGAGYNAALTDEQLKDTYEHLKKLMTNRGITLA